jgi:hypothetical protein
MPLNTFNGRPDRFARDGPGHQDHGSSVTCDHPAARGGLLDL